MMDDLRGMISDVIEELSPFIPISITLIGISSALRFILNMIRYDGGGSSVFSDSDVKEAFDKFIDEDVPEEESEETEEELSIKWTCDYCGFVHRNTDCVCDACGGRRLRW